MTAWFGTGLWVNIGSGAVAGAISGQYARLTELVLSGHTDQIRSSLFRWQDLVLDIALGGVGGAISYGIKQCLPRIAQGILQRLTNSANQRLGANPALARGVLSPAEYTAGQGDAAIARMQYGNAIERMVSGEINETPLISRLFHHVGGPNNPDFIGRGWFSGLNFDISTNTSRSIANHLLRAYGEGLLIVTYSRPITFGVFP